jgi:hypothetical protein
MRAIQQYLGHRNIQHTVKYTELARSVSGDAGRTETMTREALRGTDFRATRRDGETAEGNDLGCRWKDQTMRSGRVALFVGFYLIASVASTLAEEAWVLWVRDERIDYVKKTQHDSWEVLYAARTENLCRLELSTALERTTSTLKNGVRYTQEQNIISLEFFRANAAGQAVGTPIGVQRFSYICLPGKVDPRKEK